eukprot:scaffold1355_cov268-Pinguiococcus_pyrenoidosus.AAC.38
MGLTLVDFSCLQLLPLRAPFLLVFLRPRVLASSCSCRLARPSEPKACAAPPSPRVRPVPALHVSLLSRKSRWAWKSPERRSSPSSKAVR